MTIVRLLVHRVVLFLMFLATMLLEPGLSLCAIGSGTGSNRSSADGEVVVARVGDREITVRDFFERAEYTLRPPYCRGSSNNDKNIVLSSLVAEKILAMEAGTNTELMKTPEFLNFIAGRREQKMRELLYYFEGEGKVRLDTGEVQRIFSLAGRTYRVQYVALKSPAHPDAIEGKQEDSTAKALFSGYDRGLDSLPEVEMSWSSPQTRSIRKALFLQPLKKGQILGPLRIGDTADVFIRIKGWDERVAVSATDRATRFADVTDELTAMKADSVFDRYVLKVLKGKSIRFDVDAFNRLTALLVPFYSKREEKAKEEFLQFTYKRNIAKPEFAGDEYYQIMDLPLLSIDGNTWTIRDLKGEIDKHPLVFRRANHKDKFAQQLRLAIVDLVRDKYLTDVAYKRGYDKHALVVHYEQSWRDASIAMFERDKFLRDLSVDSTHAGREMEEFLNPYVKNLLKRYSGRIEVNVDAYDKIGLTRIDMFATQSDVPYPIYVPAFPALTTYNRLDYGRKMK